jgi:hypothetical protein
MKNGRWTMVLYVSIAAAAALATTSIRRAHADAGPAVCTRVALPAQVCEYQFPDGTKCVLYGLTGSSDTAQVAGGSGMQCKFP